MTISPAFDLARAILGDSAFSDHDVSVAMEAALALEVEPLAYFATRFGLGEALVFERAAKWVGLAFSPSVPPLVEGSCAVRRLDDFGHTRTLRGRLFEREIVFTAPGFFHLTRLRRHVAAYPELRTKTCIVPESAIRAGLGRANQGLLLNEARQRLARRWPFASAHLDLSLVARICFVMMMVLGVLFCGVAPFWMGPAVLPVVCALLLGPAAMRLLALAPRHARGPDDLVPPLADADLPVYSVLIPLRDEDQMVPLLERAMSNLDYPPEKLDIKFVVEAKSTATVRAVEMLLGDLRFELVSVPDAIPRTKPKALNYALPFVRGSCVVVYDAEDIPDSDQLRLAAARFAADQGVDCLQAELVVDNAHETWLTALFAGEYAGQFGVMLPALTRWHLPVPLGGTSNHFRAGALRELGGWDAFNVTEDADLGVRLARLRYRTGMLASETREEAPISLAAWSAQRTRWMKGWMQTLIVHNQNPWRLYQDIGWRGFIAFEIYTGSMILAPLLHTLFLGGLAVRVLFGPVPALLNGNYLSLADIVILVVGYASAAGLVVRGLVRRKQGHLVGYQFALPLYWVLHSAATVRAAIELLVRPYFWDKTAHGRTRLARSFARNRNRNERAGS